MLKFLASPSSLQVRIAEQQSARDVKTRKSAGKPNAEWRVRERIVNLNSEKNPQCKGPIVKNSSPLNFLRFLLVKIAHVTR